MSVQQLSPFPSSADTCKISSKITSHYWKNARVLPWRAPPGGALPNAYLVWLSEVMLQQTTVAAVGRYFEDFTRRWPTVTDLAGAQDADILAAWAGLGYYARARNLIACARIVAEERGGQFPQTEAELRTLPGIGDYTAAAIAAFAFGQRTVVVDANIERLMARLFAIAVPLPAGKANIRTAMDVLTPKNGAGDFAQACMDIGATICTARLPKCPQCPVQMHCEAFLTGTPEHFPVKPAKKAKPLRRGRFFWIQQDGHVLLVTRPNTGMLGGMRALPDDNWSAAADGEAIPPMASQWTIVPDIIQHSFTHFTICVDLAVYRGPKLAKANRIGEWWPLESWDKAGLPTLYAKTIRRWMMIRNKDDND